MAGAFHGVTEADSIINVGVSGPGVVKTALEKVRGEDFETLCEMIKRTAFKVTRVGQLVAQGGFQDVLVFHLELWIFPLRLHRQSVTVWLRSWKKSVLKEPVHLELQQLLPC